MSQPEVVKSRIIDASWTVGTPPAHDEPQPQTATDGAGGGDAHDDPEIEVAVRPVQTIVVQPLGEQGITPFSWPPSPVDIVEEVQLPEQLDPRLVVLRAPESEQACAYRLLQHRLFAKGDPRVVVVTGAERGCGKTTCAANLALALAESPLSRVLLVDANLARPGVADLFGYEPAHSFMFQLSGGEGLNMPHTVASVRGLSLELAGLLPTGAVGKRLDRMLFAQAIAALRACYDYIVIDTASTLETADVSDVSECADGVVLVARSGVTRVDGLNRAQEQLPEGRVLGAVLVDA